MKNYFILISMLLAGCSQSPDFKTFPKIDTHVHLETVDDSFVQVLDENSFQLLSLITRSESQEAIMKDFVFAKDLHKSHPATIGYATTISMEGFGEPDWQESYRKVLMTELLRLKYGKT